MNPKTKAFFDPATFTVTYVVKEPGGHGCVIIDPVLDYDPKSGCTSTASADSVLAYIKENELSVEWILETHAHADHLSAAQYLKALTGGTTGIGERITEVQGAFKEIFNAGSSFATNGSQFDHLFADGEAFRIGGMTARVMHTPGHTPACVTYIIGESAFVGDTLFMPDYGTARTDFPGGDAKTLYRSIQRLLSLPDEMRLFMCHDYKAPGREEYAWETTVAEQRERNVHVGGGVTEAAFAEMRAARDSTLNMPALLLPSVQVNMRGGRLPPTEDNGVSYLKIPVDTL